MRLLTAFIALLASAAPALAQPPFVDPALQWAAPGEPQRRQHPGLAAAGMQPPDDTTVYRVIAAGDEFEVAKRIAIGGGKVLGYHKGAVHAEVTRAQLALLAGDDALSRLEISRRVYPQLDVSRPFIHADEVQAGTNLDQPYTGKGVIVGIVDTGIDIGHSAFRNKDGSTRILALWDQTLDYEDGSRRPDGFAYGIECLAEHIDAYNLDGASAIDSCPSDDGRDIGGIPTEGHGTHVAGIATSSDATYRGIAPEASLVVVRALFEEGGILDGVDYVLSKCDSWGRPCVINLSLGTTAGAHDGTALIEKLLGGKTGPGRIIVASAGNEAMPDDSSGFGHAAMQFSSAAGVLKGPIVFPDASTVKNDDFSILIDAWSSGTDNHAFYIAAGEAQAGSVVVFNAFTGDFVTPPVDGSSLTHVLSSGSEVHAYAHFATAIDPENDRRETIIAIDRCSDKPCSAGGKIDGSVADLTSKLFIINAQNGASDRLDMWPIYVSGFFYGPAPVSLDFTWSGVSADSGTNTHVLTPGDNTSTVTIPSTARDIIAVGSMITKTQWTSINGTRQDQGGTRGELSVFSSHGPTSDGRIKPDVTAPGEWIASAHSSKETTLPQPLIPAEGFVHLQGTSMASPHVAGLVALMLQRDHALAPEDLIGDTGLVTQNTQSTDFSGTLPNNDFGYGVIDAAQVFGDTRLNKGDELDQTAPAITSIKVSVSGSQATVQWATDEPSTSAVLFQREGGGKDKAASRLSYTRSHRIKVNGLSEGTYRVTIRGTDLAGNTSSRQGPTVEAGGACGCQSRSGASTSDALPFVLLLGAIVAVRLRLAA